MEIRGMSFFPSIVSARVGTNHTMNQERERRGCGAVARPRYGWRREKRYKYSVASKSDHIIALGGRIGDDCRRFSVSTIPAASFPRSHHAMIITGKTP